MRHFHHKYGVSPIQVYETQTEDKISGKNKGRRNPSLFVIFNV